MPREIKLQSIATKVSLPYVAVSTTVEAAKEIVAAD